MSTSLRANGTVVSRWLQVLLEISPQKGMQIILPKLITSVYAFEKFSTVQYLEYLCCFVAHESLVDAIVPDKWDISANEKHYPSNVTHSFWFVIENNYDIAMWSYENVISIWSPSYGNMLSISSHWHQWDRRSKVFIDKVVFITDFAPHFTGNDCQKF